MGTTELLLAVIAAEGAVIGFMGQRFYTYLVRTLNDHEGRLDRLENFTGIERRKRGVTHGT